MKQYFVVTPGFIDSKDPANLSDEPRTNLVGQRFAKSSDSFKNPESTNFEEKVTLFILM